MRDRGEVLALLDAKTDGDCSRVRVRLGGPDPRIELRERDTLTDAEADDLHTRLGRLDARSASGSWTDQVLALIAEHPHVRAPDLAARLGRDAASFKADVRKLKALGLTISHSPGYELSPRGRALRARTERGSG